MDKAELKRRLTPEQYRVTQEKGTEVPFTGEYNTVFDEGVYKCVVCGEPLFSSDTKYQDNCGWPSFTKPLEGAKILEKDDYSYFMHRIEVQCKNCGAHLGHVFDDGPGPDGTHYCINSAALNFEEKKA